METTEEVHGQIYSVEEHSARSITAEVGGGVWRQETVVGLQEGHTE